MEYFAVFVLLINLTASQKIPQYYWPLDSSLNGLVHIQNTTVSNQIRTTYDRFNQNAEVAFIFDIANWLQALPGFYFNKSFTLSVWIRLNTDLQDKFNILEFSDTNQETSVRLSLEPTPVFYISDFKVITTSFLQLIRLFLVLFSSRSVHSLLNKPILEP